MGSVVTAMAASGSFSVSFLRGPRKSPSSLFGRMQPVEQVDAADSSSLLVNQADSSWLKNSVKRVAELMRSTDCVDLSAVIRCLTFLGEITSPMPRPFFAIGDDGSIGVEWSVKGNYLYLTFGTKGDEAYWDGRNGDEWEADLAMPPGKLFDALEELIVG